MLEAAIRIVGLGGSLAELSRSRTALRLSVEGAASAGAESELLDLRELDLPPYNSDRDEPTAIASRLIESCCRGDGMLWSSPLYQGTIRNVQERTRLAARAWSP